MLQQTFSLSHDEIVSGEYFSHTNEPMFTFNPSRNLIYVNAVSLKNLPNMDYALIVISSREKRLSIFPCDTYERDAVRLRSGGQHRTKPRQVRCNADFKNKMLSLMEWSSDCRYRVVGYMAKGNDDTIIAFDLSSAEVFAPGEYTANASVQLQGVFGSAFDEQRSNPLIRTVKQDTEIILTETGGESVDEI